MTGEPRRPLFGFLFAPRPPTPGAPQIRWLRIPARGPWRLALLITATLGFASVAGSAFLAIASARSVEGLAIGALSMLVVLPVVAVIARGWIIGTYVNDSGVRVVGWRRTDVAPWPIVTSVDTVPARLGERLVIRTAEGTIPTTIGSFTADTALREQAWLSSVDRMRIWHRESGDQPSGPPG